jgi:uncharacterized protein
MLDLHSDCECCDRADSSEALICSFECTFCRSCADHVLGGRCPNCAGELSVPPRRSVATLVKYPAATRRVLKSQGCSEQAR